MNDHVRIRIGIVGAGQAAFMGPIHLMAARLDGEFDLVCGAFSRDHTRSQAAGLSYGLAAQRIYASYEEMFRLEQARPADGLQSVIVATPNDSHLAISTAALKSGLHVLSDKPAARTVAEAEALERIVRTAGRVYGLTYTYSGYPLIREARAICASGRLGHIRKVFVEYLQGWLSQPIENDGNMQAAWRTDPARAGRGGCISDIGVHAFHMLEFVTGCKVTRTAADVSTLIGGRRLNDDFNALVRLENGASGVISASQAATGEGNGLRLRIYAELGALEWNQERPDRLLIRWLNGSTESLRAGNNSAMLTSDGRAASRLPLGHPEGYIEALGNIYRDFAQNIRKPGSSATLPSIAQGVRGLRFVEAVLSSSENGTRWVVLPA